jgi:hypothetical protein
MMSAGVSGKQALFNNRQGMEGRRGDSAQAAVCESVHVPETPWRRGKHKLLIRTTIEDLAGNNIGEPFDVDKLESTAKPALAAVTLSLEVR